MNIHDRSATAASTEFAALKSRLEATWSTGDYDTFSRYMQKDAESFYDRLHVPVGARLLDVACGAGQLALIAARNGAVVTMAGGACTKAIIVVGGALATDMKESDDYFLVGEIGTANNLAVRDYLNERCVPSICCADFPAMPQ